MLLALVSAAVPAAAQSASGEIAGGYSYLRMDGEGLPEGWFVSGAVDLTPALSIVGEVFSNGRNLSHDDLLEGTDPEVSPDGLTFDEFVESVGVEASVTVRSLAGGIRYRGSRGRGGWFVQSVAGPAWVDARMSLLGLDISISPLDLGMADRQRPGRVRVAPCGLAAARRLSPRGRIRAG